MNTGNWINLGGFLAVIGCYLTMRWADRRSERRHQALLERQATENRRSREGKSPRPPDTGSRGGMGMPSW